MRKIFTHSVFSFIFLFSCKSKPASLPDQLKENFMIPPLIKICNPRIVYFVILPSCKNNKLVKIFFASFCIWRKFELNVNAFGVGLET
jgi:hypothetical protein